jgi:hypothetical protein
MSSETVFRPGVSSSPPLLSSVSVVVGFERSRLVEPHVLGLVVAELREVRVEGREVERRHKLVHELGHQVDVGLVAAGGSVEQLWKKDK